MKSRLFSASEVVRVARSQLLPSRAMLRLTAYFGAVALFTSFWLARSLYAAAREDVFSVGHELVGLSTLTHGAESVSLNGERFHHAVVSSTEPLHQVLDRIEQHCRENPGAAALELDRLAASAPRSFERHAPKGALRNAVFRDETGTRGVVLCFEGAPSLRQPESLLAAVRSFSQNRDLSAFGRLVYTFAEGGEHERTRVVTLWADTGLDLSTLFPKSGDAPGSDSPVVPRPPEARRTLSASAGGVPFAVRLYESQQSLATTQQFYDSWMTAHGYLAAHELAQGASGYLRADGYQVFLSLMRNHEHTFVTLTETGARDPLATFTVGAEP